MKKIRRIKMVVKQLVVIKKRIAAPHSCPFCKCASAAEELAGIQSPPRLDGNQKTE